MKIEKSKIWHSKVFENCFLIVLENNNGYIKCLMNHSKDFIEETYHYDFYILENYYLGR